MRPSLANSRTASPSMENSVRRLLRVHGRTGSRRCLSGVRPRCGKRRVSVTVPLEKDDVLDRATRWVGSADRAARDGYRTVEVLARAMGTSWTREERCGGCDGQPTLADLETALFPGTESREDRRGHAVPPPPTAPSQNTSGTQVPGGTRRWCGSHRKAQSAAHHSRADPVHPPLSRPR